MFSSDQNFTLLSLIPIRLERDDFGGFTSVRLRMTHNLWPISYGPYEYKLKIVSSKFDKNESEFCNGCISPE